MMDFSPTNELPTAATLRRLVDGVYSIVDAVRRADWAAVSDGADVATEVGSAVYSSAVASIQALASAAPFEVHGEQWLAMWKRLAEAGTARPLVDELQQKLPPELARRHADSLDRLADGRHADNQFLAYVTRTIERGGSGGERFVAGLGIIGMSRGLLARVHTAVNRPPPTRADDQVSLERERRDFEQRLRAAATRLYCAWEHPDTEMEAAQDLTRFVERELPGFAAVQGAALKALEGQISSVDAAAIRGQLLESAPVVRDAIAMHAGAYRAIVDASARSVGDTVTERTAPPNFDVDVHRGRPVVLSQLPATAPDELVTVEGVVESIRIVREDKLVTSLVLSDEQGHGAQLDIVFAHLPHAGLTVGAQCRATGYVVEQDPSRLPIVRAEQLDSSRLAEVAWVKYLISRASPWFHRWRNRANVDWSLGLHLNLEDRGGAAELMFSPLMRDLGI